MKHHSLPVFIIILKTNIDRVYCTTGTNTDNVYTFASTVFVHLDFVSLYLNRITSEKLFKDTRSLERSKSTSLFWTKVFELTKARSSSHNDV